MAAVAGMSGLSLAASYEVAIKADRSAVEDCCDELGMSLDDLKRLISSYREPAQSTTQWFTPHVDVLTWLLVRLSSKSQHSQMTPAAYEAEVTDRLGRAQAESSVVFPLWVPCAPAARALAGRLPACPLVSFDEHLDLAHAGLVGHFGQRAQLIGLEHAEIAFSGVLWRLGTLVEAVMDDLQGSSLFTKVAQLKKTLLSRRDLSHMERDLVESLVPDMAHRRNALTHMSDNHSWNFSTSAQECLSCTDELWSMAAATSLAFIAHIWKNVRDAEAPRAQAVAIQRDAVWP